MASNEELGLEASEHLPSLPSTELSFGHSQPRRGLEPCTLTISKLQDLEASAGR